MKLISVCVITVAISLSSCGSSLPTVKPRTCDKIEVGPGTEDMVLDTISGSGPRLIISSHDRRNWATTGDVYELNLETQKVSKMTRVGEPAGLEFRPQDLDIVKTESGKILLYVGIHDNQLEGAYHAVLVYSVDRSNLVFQQIIEDPILTSPNGIRAFPDETFYVAIDREDRSSKATLLFNLKKGSIYFYGKDKKFHLASPEKISYANSIDVDGERLFLSASGESKIYSFKREADGNLTDKQVFAAVKADNVWINDGYIYTQTHPSTFKIFRHLKSKDNLAPSVVSRIGLKDKTQQYIYVDDGSFFGAASSAFKYKSKIYMGQIADSDILKCDASDL
ncbi:MAG: hypothetical protein K8S54_13265 [Spirochaetia bacterium]|nr:hypothetical protein [Spirochaetia bacterium]